MLKRSLLIPVVSLALLAGCAGTPEALARQPIPTLSASELPSPTPVAELPGSIVLGGDHWEVRESDGTVTSSLAYTEPASVVLERLVELLGDDYELSEYLADDGCGQDPAHIYSWGGGRFGLSDSTGLSANPPLDVVPYSLYARVNEIDGVEIVSTIGVSVGDDVSALPASNDPNNGTGIILLEGGGTYERRSGMGDGTMIQADWGLFALSATDPHAVEFLSAPTTGADFFC